MTNEATNTDPLEACLWASTRLKQAGFVHVYTSMQSEACYYLWPGRRGVLRVSAHSAKRSRGIPNSEQPLWACCTFGRNQGTISPEQLEFRLAAAIGRYFLAETRGGLGEADAA